MDTYFLSFRTNSAYTFTVPMKDKSFRFYIKYDINKDRYYMDIYQLEDGQYNLKVSSLFLTTGCNLFQQYQYLGLGNMYIIPKTDIYYDNVVNRANVKTNNGLEEVEIRGAYPGAKTIKDFYYMIWEHN